MWQIMPAVHTSGVPATPDAIAGGGVPPLTERPNARMCVRGSSPGKRGSTPRSIQAMLSVSDENVHAERQGAATSVAYKQRHRIVHYMGIYRQKSSGVVSQARLA